MLSRFKLLIHQVQFVLYVYSWMCGYPLEHGQLPRARQALRENGRSPFQRLSVASSSLAKDGTSYLTPVSMLGFGLAGACAGPCVDCHTHCGFIHRAAPLCTEDTVS